MALGGGTFITQNKTLPGSYINFVSASNASASISDRGYAAMAMTLNWGAEGKVFMVTADEFLSDSLKIFGYDYSADQLKGLRDLFKNINTGYFYRLNTGVKATCTYATAKHGGIRGNDLKIVIGTNADNSSKYDVKTYLGTTLVDTQTVSGMSTLVSNDFVTFNTAATIALTSGTSLSGGTNGSAVTGSDYQSFLDKIESCSFNTLGCVSTDDTIKALYAAFTKRMRDEAGIKFQCVLHKYAADYEGVVSVENNLVGSTGADASAVYWVTGALSGCEINKSVTNKLYDGEYAINTGYTQSQLEEAIKGGKFIFHKVGANTRVLEDINTFISTTDEKSVDFSSNQTIRVLDQIANDIAVMFNTKYLGSVPNDSAGRISFWNDVVKHHQQLEKIRAIENFSSADVSVSVGSTKKSVVVTDKVTVVNAMEQLYMTVTVE